MASTLDQMLSDRALKYGRNMVVIAVTLTVLAWVPVIDLEKSKPLSFTIKAGGELWLWTLLVSLLFYYAVRFYGLALPDISAWKRAYGKINSKIAGEVSSFANSIENDRRQLKELTEEIGKRKESGKNTQNFEEKVGNIKNQILSTTEKMRQKRSELSEHIWRQRYSWIVDLALPSILAACAFVAASTEIYALLIFKQ